MLGLDNKFDLIISGGTVINHAGRLDLDVGIIGGKIAAIGDLSDALCDERLDAKGLTLLPGVIDTNVHFSEPEADYREDFESGSRSAVLGGVTTVFEMPAQNPATASAEAITDKIRRAVDRMWCDYAFYIAATPANYPALSWMERLPGVCGVSIAMAGRDEDFAITDDSTLFNALRRGGRRVTVQAQDQGLLAAGRGKQIPGEVASHALWHDESVAQKGLARLLRLARRAGRKVHVQSISSDSEMALLASNKDIMSADVSPQHLSFASPEAYAAWGERLQLDPPIREERHQIALWHGLQMGVVDVLASQHRPYLIAEKEAAYPEGPSGVPAVQTLLPIMLHHVAQGHLSLEQLVDLTSAGPGRVFGLRDKGRLAVGYDADLTFVDLKKDWMIDSSWIAARCGWTPYHGCAVKGMPVGTVVRGQIAAWQGTLGPRPTGEAVRFLDCVRGEVEA